MVLKIKLWVILKQTKTSTIINQNVSKMCLVVERKLKIKKQSEDKIIKNIRHSFKLKKENEPINGRIIRENKTIFEQEEDL